MLFLFTFTRYKNDGIRSGDFSTNADQQWLYVAGDYPVQTGTIPNQIYMPEQIRWSNFALDGERLDTELQVQVPRDNPVAGLYSSGAPSRPIWLRIQSIPYGVADGSVDGYMAVVGASNGAIAANTLFHGRIKSVEFNDLTATINAAAIGDLLKRQGLRTSFSPTCSKVFGSQPGPGAGSPAYSGTLDGACGVALSALTPLVGQVVSTVSADGLTVTLSAGFTDDTYSAGLAYYEPPVGSDPTHYYTIARQLGAVLTMSRPIPNLAPGSLLTLRKGCLKTKEACQAYSNIANFGGFPLIPNRNPFIKV